MSACRVTSSQLQTKVNEIEGRQKKAIQTKPTEIKGRQKKKVEAERTEGRVATCKNQRHTSTLASKKNHVLDLFDYA